MIPGFPPLMLSKILGLYEIWYGLPGIDGDTIDKGVGAILFYKPQCFIVLQKRTLKILESSKLCTCINLQYVQAYMQYVQV